MDTLRSFSRLRVREVIVLFVLFTYYTFATPRAGVFVAEDGNDDDDVADKTVAAGADAPEGEGGGGGGA